MTVCVSRLVAWLVFKTFCLHFEEQFSCLTMNEAIGYNEKCVMICDEDLEFMNKMRMENSSSGIIKVCSSKDLLIH